MSIKETALFKKLDNFWYHHKFKVLVLSGLIIIVLVASIQSLTRVKPDYYVILRTNSVFIPEVVEGFEQTLAAYGTDLNGDGKVVVRVNDTAYSVNSPQNYRALQQQKFNSEMMNSSTYLFITDESVYNEISEKVFIPEAFLTHAQKAFPTKGTKFETELLQNIRLPEGESFTPAPYYISIRKCDPNNTLGYKRQAEATELLKRVISGTNPQKETVQNEK